MTYEELVKAVEDFRDAEEVEVLPEHICELLTPRKIKRTKPPKGFLFSGTLRIEREEE